MAESAFAMDPKGCVNGKVLDGADLVLQTLHDRSLIENMRACETSAHRRKGIIRGGGRGRRR